MRLGQKRIAKIFHQGGFSPIIASRAGKATRDLTLGSHGWLATACTAASPFIAGLSTGPLDRLQDVVGISGGHQHLRQQTVRVERDRGDPLINLRLV